VDNAGADCAHDPHLDRSYRHIGIVLGSASGSAGVADVLLVPFVTIMLGIDMNYAGMARPSRVPNRSRKVV
jgi:hypothetical protein